jgi:hypothetical protein
MVLSTSPPAFSTLPDSVACCEQPTPDPISPLTYRQIERLVEVMLDLRDGENLVLDDSQVHDFRPSSDKASLEILGTIAQRLEECRRRFEPCTCSLYIRTCRCKSAVEKVAIIEKYERQCGDEERLASRAADPEQEKKCAKARKSAGRLAAKFRESLVFRRSMCLLAFTLAAAAAEDFRIRLIVERT